MKLKIPVQFMKTMLFGKGTLEDALDFKFQFHCQLLDASHSPVKCNRMSCLNQEAEGNSLCFRTLTHDSIDFDAKSLPLVLGLSARAKAHRNDMGPVYAIKAHQAGPSFSAGTNTHASKTQSNSKRSMSLRFILRRTGLKLGGGGVGGLACDEPLRALQRKWILST